MERINASDLYNLLTSIDWQSTHGHISFKLAGQDVIVKTTDPVGIALQSWLGAFMRDKNIYVREQPNSQEFPDYFLSDRDDVDMLEVKSFMFNRSPAFDIANFESYCDSLKVAPYKLDADYVIFGYEMTEAGEIWVRKVWVKKVWEIAGSSSRYPLKVQDKRGMIYNIRPNSQFKSGRPTPFDTKQQFVRAIYETLNIYKGSIFADEWLNAFRVAYRSHYGDDFNI